MDIENMEMPTPCPCGEIVELNDLKTSGKCEELRCWRCLEEAIKTIKQ